MIIILRFEMRKGLTCPCYVFTLRKKCVLQLALEFNLYTMNVNEQVAWIVKLQFIVYMEQFIATQLQLYQNN
jgi:hypothetical protein